uniref:Uncharacterized protein n=1 Tax=Caenorhabditis japonica TaxID=281687 RepID=A0A8R1I7N2_CAEJA
MSKKNPRLTNTDINSELKDQYGVQDSVQGHCQKTSAQRWTLQKGPSEQANDSGEEPFSSTELRHLLPWSTTVKEKRHHDRLRIKRRNTSKIDGISQPAEIRHNRSSVSSPGDFKVDLHKSIMEMNTKMRDLEELVAVQQKRLESVEAAMKEVKEKKEDLAEIKERRRSIVAIGVPEATCSSMFERSAADINAVHELFKCVDATSPPITVYRLGRQREDGKPRLLKIVLSSTFAQRDVLKKAHKLKSFRTTDGRPIFLRPSMSREELVQYHDNRRKNYANKSLATNANATPLQIRKDTPTNIFTDPKN